MLWLNGGVIPMSEVALSRRIVRFDTFEVNFRKGEMRKHGFRIEALRLPTEGEVQSESGDHGSNVQV